MTDETILKNWKSGLSALTIAKKYRKDVNKMSKISGQACISEQEALGYVEQIIFDYETKDWGF